MSLKTLHFNNYWHQTSGGVAQFYRALMASANRNGHSLRLVVPDDKTWEEPVGEYCKIYHVAAPSAPLNSSYRLLYPTQFLQSGTTLQKILIRERPDLVEICDKYTLNYLGALLRIGGLRDITFRPVVVGTSHERMDDNFNIYLGHRAFGRWFCAWYMRWIYFPFFDHHIANSRYTAEELSAAAQHHPQQRGVWVRPPGVDCTRLSPTLKSADARERLVQRAGVHPDSILLLYVGRLAPEKNLGLLLDTMAELAAACANSGDNRRDYQLLVIGQGTEQAWLLREAERRAPGHVKLLGHLADRDELAEVYANCDMFVHPNPREPFGIAPLEAMASGLPLVAPTSGGVTTYANSQNAWLVEPNAEAFADAIQSIASSAVQRIAKASAALITAEKFRWETVADNYLQLLRDMAASPLSLQVAQPADFYSTPATASSGMVTRVASAAAQKAFAAAVRWKLLPTRSG